MCENIWLKHPKLQYYEIRTLVEISPINHSESYSRRILDNILTHFGAHEAGAKTFWNIGLHSRIVPRCRSRQRKPWHDSLTWKSSTSIPAIMVNITSLTRFHANPFFKSRGSLPPQRQLEPTLTTSIRWSDLFSLHNISPNWQKLIGPLIIFAFTVNKIQI